MKENGNNVRNRKLCVIVVSHCFEEAGWIDKCLSSLLNSSLIPDIVVVDNNSTDNTCSRIKSEYPKIRLFEKTENLGFAKANNIGLKYALEQGYDYVFLLNQDAWVEESTLERLVQICDNNPEYGIISPVHLTGEGDQIDNAFAGYMRGVQDSRFLTDLFFDRKALYQVPFVNAAAWMMRINTIKSIGGFDTSLFIHYGEDDNYCQRMKFHDLKIGIYTGVCIFHDRAFRKASDVFFPKETRAFIKYGDITKNYTEIQHPVIYSLFYYIKCNLKRDRLKWQEYRNQAVIALRNRKRLIKSRRINRTIGAHWLHNNVIGDDVGLLKHNLFMSRVRNNEHGSN